MKPKRSMFCVVALVYAGLATANTAKTPEASVRAPDVTLSHEVHRDISRPLREILTELPAPGPRPGGEYVVPNRPFEVSAPQSAADTRTPTSVQRAPVGTPVPAPVVSADGLRRALAGNVQPPDPTGDVGPEHYFQWVNTAWALFNKTTGALVSGPASGNSFWAGFGGLCQSTNQGDPLVLFDDIAQRWVVSQFAFTSLTTGPFLQCVAVSTSADPLGTYHRYAFSYPAFNDYGKMGVWVTRDGGQNAYVFTMHEVSADGTSASFALVERSRMLTGESAKFIRVGNLDAVGALPLHLEGVHALPSGSCPIFVHFRGSGDGYRLWDMCVNWAAGTTTFTDTPTFVPSQRFVLGLSGIPQLNSTTRLEDFGAFSMYRAVIRAFGDTGPLEAKAVLNHTVKVGSNQAGIRWVQFGLSAPNPFQSGATVFANGFEAVGIAATPTPMQKRLLDQGTYAPDTESRWMGSINLDASGNIGLGQNVSSSAINPQIRVTGRLRTEAAGTLRDEQTCTPPNTGAQTGLFDGRARWGDYATMAVDPVDQCTFWFTGEYYSTTSASSWNTRTCAFRFAECGQTDFEFELSTPGRVQICGSNGPDPVIAVRPGAYGGALASQVAITAIGVPTGASVSFAPASVAAGAITQMTLRDFDTLAPGTHAFTISGTAGALTRTRTVNVDTAAVIPQPPALTSPAAGATNQALRPTLQWSAANGVNSYLVQIATDAGFSTIIDSGTTSTTSYVPEVTLAAGQSVHWRVRSINACGDSAFSPARQFTTAGADACPPGTTANIVFNDDVSGDAIAWTTQNVTGPETAHWRKTIPAGVSGMTTRAWVAGNEEDRTDQRLSTPAIALPPLTQRPILFSFDSHHRYETIDAERCADGGFVEISTNGGASFTLLDNSRNLADPYQGLLSQVNPAPNTPAWCRQAFTGVPVRAVFLLDDFAGQSVILRFRSTGDKFGAESPPAGWVVDNVTVKGCQ